MPVVSIVVGFIPRDVALLESPSALMNVAWAMLSSKSLGVFFGFCFEVAFSISVLGVADFACVLGAGVLEVTLG